MPLTNPSATPRNDVNLSRYFDGDIDETFADDLYTLNADLVWG